MAASGVRFDLFRAQEAPWPALLDEVRSLEGLSIGTVWIADHYAWPPHPAYNILEAWTTLAALAASTTRIRLGTLVSNVATRHPAMLAKQVATVDCISGGRLELGLGPGFFDREHHWLGIPFLTPGGRVDRLREAVEVIDRLLRDQQLTYHGTYYHLDDAPLVPVSVQRPRPPLIIAAQGKKALRVVADYADGWVSIGSGGASEAEMREPLKEALPRLREQNDLLDDYCTAVGRDPRTLERSYFAGWAKGEVPFASREDFQDFVGRYQEVGVQRFILGRDIAPREVLDAFLAQAMADLQGAT